MIAATEDIKTNIAVKTETIDVLDPVAPGNSRTSNLITEVKEDITKAAGMY